MYIKSVLFYFLSFILWTKEIPSGSSFHKLILWNTGYSQYQTLVDDQFCLHTDPGGTLKFPLNTIIKLCQNKQNLYFYLNNDKFHTSYLNILKKINPKILEISYSKLLISNRISKNHLILTFGHLDKDRIDETFNFNLETSKPRMLFAEKSSFNSRTVLDFLNAEKKKKNIRLNERYNFENYLNSKNKNLKSKTQVYKQEIKNACSAKEIEKSYKIIITRSIAKPTVKPKLKPMISLILPNHGQPKYLTKDKVQHLSKFNMLITGSQSRRYENHKITEIKFLKAHKPLILKNQWGHLVFEVRF